MKKKNVVLSIVLIVCVGILVGTGYLFNDLFPKAKPIRHPELDEIISVMLSCNTLEGTIPMGEEHSENLIRYISEAKPTRKQSLNDHPTALPYYDIELQTIDMQYRYFIYKEGGRVYIEMPYEGIYRASGELFSFRLPDTK